METRARTTHKIATFLTQREAEQIERLARDADRSVSAEVRLVLRRHLTDKGDPMMAVKTDPVTVREALDAGATLHFFDQVKAKVTEAWDGTPCETVLDARRAVAAAKASQWENDRLHSDYRAWLSQREAEGAQVWRGLYGSELAEAMRAQVKKTQRLHDAGSDPAGEYGQVWAAGGGFPVSLTRADPGTEWKARDAAKAARQVWDRKNPQLDLDGFRKARN